MFYKQFGLEYGIKIIKFGSRIEYHFQETGQLVEAFSKDLTQKLARELIDTYKDELAN